MAGSQKEAVNSSRLLPLCMCLRAGGARAGNRTMLDALLPAAEALREAAEKGGESVSVKDTVDMQCRWRLGGRGDGVSSGQGVVKRLERVEVWKEEMQATLERWLIWREG